MNSEKTPPALVGANGATFGQRIDTAPIAVDAWTQAPTGMQLDILVETQNYMFSSAPHQHATITQSGAIGLIAGIVGKAYNISGTGLNQYVLLLAQTGMGKEAIASGSSRLMHEVSRSVPDATSFIGASHFASQQAGIKALAKQPSMFCIFGEFAHKFGAMTDKRASPADRGLAAFFLDVYGKSGHGASLGAMAYSDAANNVAAIASPALTILGESNPSSLYELLDESMVASGLLSRFLIFEATGQRSQLNPNAGHKPPEALVQALANLCAHCLSLTARGVVHAVQQDSGARDLLDMFGRFATDTINSSNSDVLRQLWNRAHLKAIKLAALYAVGRNYINPLISYVDALTATELIAQQTIALIAKFTNDEVGEVEGSEVKQLAEVRRVIAEYVSAEHTPTAHIRFLPYKCTKEMFELQIFTKTYLTGRCLGLAAFKGPHGGSKALDLAIKKLRESDEIRSVGEKDMLSIFSTAVTAYGMTDLHKFLNSMGL